MHIKAYYNGNITLCAVVSNENRHELTDLERKKKSYKMTYSKYRQLASNCAYMFDNKINKISFLTFTIQDNIKDTSNTNKAFSYFLKQMRASKKLHSYLWVAERQKRGAVHYHGLFDLPFIPFPEIAKLFHRSFAKFNIKASDRNSVSTSKEYGAIVYSREQALKYITKYISKQINQYFRGREHAFSNNINVKPVDISHEKFLELRETTRNYYEFEYSSAYVCDINAVKEVF